MTLKLISRNLIPAGLALLALCVAAPAAAAGTNDVGVVLGFARTETATVPTADDPATVAIEVANQVTVTSAAAYRFTVKVTHGTTGAELKAVAGAPAAGEYSVAAGVYTFAAADVSAATSPLSSVVISYAHAAPSAALRYGSSRSFVARLENAGPQRVDGIALDVTFTKDWTPGSGTGTCGDADAAGTVVCRVTVGTIADLPNLPVFKTFTAAVTVPDPAPTTCTTGAVLPNVSATLIATGTTANPNTDPTAANNTSSVGGDSLVAGLADLGVTFSGPASAAPGATVQYTGTVTNNGPCPVAIVALENTYSGLSRTAATACDFTVDPDASDYAECGALAAGASLSFAFDYAVTSLPSDIVSTWIPNGVIVYDGDNTAAGNRTTVDLTGGNDGADAERLLVDGKGSVGCSSSGSGVGLLALLGLLALPLLRRRGALLAAALLLPAPILAQTTPEAAPGDDKKAVVEEITVTGSRVKRKDLTTPAPVTVLSREQVAAAGKVSIGDFLQSLPEQGNAINAQYNNGGDGSTKVNLRSLGQSRTLVLLNGRRVVGGGSSVSGTVDLNSLPTAIIERVEILKDGGSAIYGQDAVAGVVNIITRKNVNASEVAAFAGMSGHKDGKTMDLSFTSGTTGDKGSLLFSAGFFGQTSVWAGDRAWTSKIFTLDYTSATPFFTGSSATPAGRFTMNPSACTTAECVALVGAHGGGRNNWAVSPGSPGGAVPYVGTRDAYNFEPDNYLYTPARRISLFSLGDYNLGGFTRAFFEASYVGRESDQKLAPEPLFTINNGLTYSAASQYNPYRTDLTDVRRRLVEFGRRDFRQDMTTFRTVVGLDGSLPDLFGPLQGWTWDANFNYGRTAGVDSTNGTLRAPLIQDAIGPSWNGVCYKSATPNAASATNGYDYADPIAGCVPLNLLGGAGSITPDQVSALGFYGADRYVNQLNSFQANVGGELFRLLSDRPVGLAVGYEFRRVSGDSIPNPISQAGENTGNNFQRTGGAYKSNEVYAEVTVPVISNMPLAETLEAQLAARYFNYDTFGSDATYKAGVRWTPIRDFTIRGTYSTAFRAPNVQDLFRGSTDSFPTVSDPCAAPTPGSALDLLCQAHGVPAGGNGDDRTQLKEKLGGNTNLKPETAKIFSAGIVVTPTMVKGLSVTFDYYNVDLTKAIDVLGAGVIMQSCYGNPAAPKYCDLISRTSGGLVDSIDDRNTNIGGTKTSGLDLAVRYDLPTPAGRFNLIFDGTWLQKFDQTLPDGTVIKYKATYDNVLAFPTWKFNTGVLWRLKDLNAGLVAKYVGAYKECANDLGTSGADGLCYLDAAAARVISSSTTFDLNAGYALNTSFGRTNLSAGVTNLFDTKPPLIYNNGTYASDPSTYDFMGRFFYVRLAHTY